ncbi:hypothetical protein Mth01_40560 [Sphaerimonospora thailandensis]|uniref:Uncharacterized protein n=1 Tax=Sphaerimonospora thailandensis TaxID=795644 RepID=A0A8J3RG91_9ACTN|nr:hypothetical protein Mth01_40560 [Sphaerimonospora thailandensis]
MRDEVEQAGGPVDEVDRQRTRECVGGHDDAHSAGCDRQNAPAYPAAPAPEVSDSDGGDGGRGALGAAEGT